MTLRFALQLACCYLAAAVIEAAPPPLLGLATAEGDFKLNQALVRGNATLSEGAIVETLRVPSRLKFQQGTSVLLDAWSRARVQSGRLVVEAGSGELRTATSPMTIEARTLLVQAEAGSESRLRFSLAPGNDGPVRLAASAGRLQVMNAAGALISRLEPGLALAFEPLQARQAPPSAPSSFIGCIVKKDGIFMLWDPALRILVELRGAKAAVEKEWGNRVQASGTSPAEGQPQGRQLMDVTTITHLENGGCSDMAAAAAAEVPANPVASAPAAQNIPVPRAEGMSAGVKYGIIAGVAGGAAVAIGVAAGGGDKRSR